MENSSWIRLRTAGFLPVRLPRMKVERRCSAGGERRRDLARDMSGFPHPRHDDTAVGFDEEPDDLLNVLRQPAGEVRERLSL